MAFLRLFVIFITFSLMSLIGILCMYVDMQIFGLTYIAEESVTEIVQELMVFTVCILYACSIKNTKEFLRINILVFGFFTAILIREFDFVFDKISHGTGFGWLFWLALWR
ncbi:hypothetical protein [Campylobacter suis]|uniref:Uncharacterized protein n=1 Tax=Campylobacter suis TaxID=2790657 RepID=A0ABM8Q796_9BACT|nr:hypothetical protein [Campylobacter suis]CAD7288833.1 hypothetical protein LMG8286_01543 [Campylobacter suis]